MTAHTEKIVDERIVFQGKVFSVLERDIEIKPGKTVTWEVITKQGENSVAIVAIDKDEKVFLVEEYFGAINQRGLKLPMGRINEGEEPLTAADRELQEEIGFKGDLIKLANMTVSPGYMTQRTVVVLAQNLKASSLQGDEEHHFKIRKVPMKEAVAMCENGKIDEARTVAALLLAEKKIV